jgi:hypothetical protein
MSAVEHLYAAIHVIPDWPRPARKLSVTGAQAVEARLSPLNLNTFGVQKNTLCLKNVEDISEKHFLEAIIDKGLRRPVLLTQHCSKTGPTCAGAAISDPTLRSVEPIVWGMLDVHSQCAYTVVSKVHVCIKV